MRAVVTQRGHPIAPHVGFHPSAILTGLPELVKSAASEIQRINKFMAHLLVDLGIG